MRLAVWLARLILGGTFMVSGVAKMVDPIGTLTKINAYLAAWGIDDMFASGIVLVGGCAMSTVEFITGVMVATGSLRRGAPRLALLIMCFMLPLTAYIAIANPVDDCGCFGDFLVISNVATLAKNVLLTGLALFLCRYNRRAAWIFSPWIQWVELVAALAYMILIAIIGYHEQPLLDFRSYPVGEALIDNVGDDAVYVYARGQEVRGFASDNLPDDDGGWEFVEARMLAAPTAKQFALFDRASGRDVTDEVIGITSGQMLLLIPNPSEIGATGSYTANELQLFMEHRYGPGAFVAVAAADSAAVARAMDLMMADYPVYYADSKAIMAVARGNLAVVYLRNGEVAWKRTLSSINLDLLADPDADPAEIYAVDGARLFRKLTGLYLLANLIIIIVGLLPYLALIRRKGS